MQKCSFVLWLGKSYFINFNATWYGKTVNEPVYKNLKGLSMKHKKELDPFWSLPNLQLLLLFIPCKCCQSEDISYNLVPLNSVLFIIISTLLVTLWDSPIPFLFYLFLFSVHYNSIWAAQLDF